MSTANTIAEIEARAEQAERRALETEIKLGITRARLAEMEKSAAEARDAEATGAIRQLVARGVIRRDDNFTMHEWKQKFLDDPELVTFVAMKPFNRRRPC
jgi:hypothetical protein